MNLSFFGMAQDLYISYCMIDGIHPSNLSQRM